MIPSKYRKFAKAFYSISLKDLYRAKRALGEKDYPLCLFYAQQSVEKASKAMLEVKLVYKREHDIIADVANNLQDLGKELDIVLEALDYLSNAWNIARYPFLNGNEVVEPEEYISEDMCKEGIRYAEEVTKIAESYLKKYGII